jgi:hypothetical protein
MKRPVQFPHETQGAGCIVSMEPKRGLSIRHEKVALFGFTDDRR